MEDKWYFKTHVFVIALLCVGPLALPLLWFNPRLDRRKKIIITTIILIIGSAFMALFAYSVKSIYTYYHFLSEL